MPLTFQSSSGDQHGGATLTATFSAPAGTAAGDTLVAVAVGNYLETTPAPGVTAPSGWTLLGSIDSSAATGGTRASLNMWWRQATSAEVWASYTWTFAAAYAAVDYRAVWMGRWSGTNYGASAVMTDATTANATWQPSTVPANRLASYVMANVHVFTSAVNPVNTLNGWTLNTGTVANNQAAILNYDNASALRPSPVFKASTAAAGANQIVVGVAFYTISASGADWGVDRIAW